MVHLNFPLREPLVTDEPLPADDTGRPGACHTCVAHRRPPSSNGETRLGEILAESRRGIVVAGRHERETPLGIAAAAFCEALGWPLLADPLSGARRGVAAIAHYDALLRDEAFTPRGIPISSCASATCRSQSPCGRG